MPRLAVSVVFPTPLYRSRSGSFAMWTPRIPGKSRHLKGGQSFRPIISLQFLITRARSGASKAWDLRAQSRFLQHSCVLLRPDPPEVDPLGHAPLDRRSAVAAGGAQSTMRAVDHLDVRHGPPRAAAPNHDVSNCCDCSSGFTSPRTTGSFAVGRSLPEACPCAGVVNPCFGWAWRHFRLLQLHGQAQGLGMAAVWGSACAVEQ